MDENLGRVKKRRAKRKKKNWVHRKTGKKSLHQSLREREGKKTEKDREGKRGRETG